MNIPIKDKKFVFLLIAVIVVIALEILSIVDIHIPMPFEPFIFLFFIFAIGYQVIIEGLKAILGLKFSSINLLMVIAVAGAFYLGEYPEAAVVIVLYVLGERLEEIGIENSKTALEKLIAKAPKSAFVKHLQTEIQIDKVPVGTIIQVKPHDMIPLDGIIESGNTTINEAAITGEPISKEKTKGDNVFAGTLNNGGFIEIRTTVISEDTTFSKIVKLTFLASANKSDAQKFIQRFAKIYTPTIMVMAILLVIVPVLFLNLDFHHWLKQALMLLVIACPCALVISTPVAIYAAIGNASTKGILVKGGKYLEALASVKAICLDKTRTITYGNPAISDVIPLDGSTREDFLACVAGVEAQSEHPLAQAIFIAVKKEGIVPHEVENFNSVVGKGATAACLVCPKEKIVIGNLKFLKEIETINNNVEQMVQQLSADGKTTVIVSFGKGIAGIIALVDEVKPDSIEAVKGIKQLGIEPIILSGDSQASVAYTAKQVDIETFFGGFLPEDKQQKVAELILKHGKVAMVGDGINDAPALALSTVSIAMGAAGSDSAIETANIVLMNDRLSLIPFLIKLARKTERVIKVNTYGAVLIKLVFVVLAILGFGNLVFAIAADVGVTLIVILLSLRLQKY
jgi:Cd2+/Zn2+-exporting ATPase